MIFLDEYYWMPAEKEAAIVAIILARLEEENRPPLGVDNPQED